jgi:hypothetical protein
MFKMNLTPVKCKTVMLCSFLKNFSIKVSSWGEGRIKGSGGRGEFNYDVFDTLSELL